MGCTQSTQTDGVSEPVNRESVAAESVASKTASNVTAAATKQVEADKAKATASATAAESAAKAKATAASRPWAPAKDDTPEIRSEKFDKLEEELKGTMKDRAALDKLWSTMDGNGNGICSLSEIDRFVESEFPLLDHKPALMRAYKKTTLKDGDGDAWVEKNEFPALIRNLFYYNRAYEVFDAIDTGSDRRIDLGEFKAGLSKLDMKLNDTDAAAEFDTMDRNDGGQVLFDEFCIWLANKRCPVDGEVVTTSTSTASRPVEDGAADGGVVGTAVDGSAAAAAPEKDDKPEIDTSKFDAAEKEIAAIIKSSTELRKVWNAMDGNGSGKISLAEIDNWAEKKMPILDNKPALMRAYKLTTLRDGDGDSYVEKKEFPALLRNLVYFNRVFAVFDAIDTGDDRRMDLAEFKKGLPHVGMNLPDDEAEAMFAEIDTNGGGQVLFDEFCIWLAKKKCPVDDSVVDEYTTAEERASDD